MAPSRTLASRAFWELKAEQVMDRVFSAHLPGLGRGPDPHELSNPAGGSPACGDAAPIDVEVRDEPPRLPPAYLAAYEAFEPPTPAAPPPAERRPILLMLLLCSLAATGTSLLLWRGWNQATVALQQERSLQLLERLKSIGPLGGDAARETSAPVAAVNGGGDGLPPPPPEEAWVQELEPLRGGGTASQATPLRVPVSGTLTQAAAAPAGAPAVGSWVGGSGSAASPAPPPAPLPRAAGGVPELVGVVQVPGENGSAIFQMGGSSTSASVGEMIGSTGWRLRSASGESVVIERNGQQQQVSISGGF